MRYQTHPNGPPQDLRPATVADLAIGTALYLADPRRTPVRVIAHTAATASFTVAVTAFEDIGALWQFPVWQADKFLAPPGTAQLAPAAQRALTRGAARLNKPLFLKSDASRRPRTQNEILALEDGLMSAITAQDPPLPAQAGQLLARSAPSTRWSAFVQTQLKRRGLDRLDAAFTAAYASNPSAGEMVKGHLMVLADLGLADYSGPSLRDPGTLEGIGRRGDRQAHVIFRLALSRAMWRYLGQSRLTVFRGLRGTGPPRQAGFVSTTAHRSVAEALLAPSGGTLHRAEVPTSRILLSYIETPALSARFREAEILLMPGSGEGM